MTTKTKTIVVGVTMCLDDSDRITTGAEYAYIRREYGRRLGEVGAEPIFLEPSIDPGVAVELCDGIVISGGHDINPELYGQAIQNDGDLEPLERAMWEKRIIDACDQEGKPILGICYGLQLLNIHYGGTLHQDISTQFGDQVKHGVETASAMHEVEFKLDILGFKKGSVASVAARHHQAVDNLAPSMSVAAKAADGVVEAIVGRGHYGIQWHPESDDSASMVYGNFVRACDAARALTSQTLPEAVA